VDHAEHRADHEKARRREEESGAAELPGKGHCRDQDSTEQDAACRRPADHHTSGKPDPPGHLYSERPFSRHGRRAHRSLLLLGTRRYRFDLSSLPGPFAYEKGMEDANSATTA